VRTNTGSLTRSGRCANLRRYKWAGPNVRRGCAAIRIHRPGRCIGFAAANPKKASFS
jgi:hypothetical protein